MNYDKLQKIRVYCWNCDGFSDIETDGTCSQCGECITEDEEDYFPDDSGFIDEFDSNS